MEKHEFESLVGHAVDPKCYERIEFVYMHCALFDNKQELANFYMRYDMNGIERLYHAYITREHRQLELELVREMVKMAEKAYYEQNDAYLDLMKQYTSSLGK